MITKIGFAAGDIWQLLDKQNGPVTFKKICEAIDAPRDFLLMSLGWLAREGHVVMEEIKLPRRGQRDYKVTLRSRKGGE
ncbi:MAG TPA: winged helix-turn-helix domain-containing protein [bacterium]|uniref:Winged helix-turn-helix domain-containing protein n=1 Tax=candidate division TA06 bacterium ADurb.Bin417 TaxID=1852828 RepID=A0A1V5M9E8_UNCT6|nr:MAG: hypothetical protein BWY73_01431 [candidate division TA06 bacterium ADurb.Bin417]HNQ35635.1 winged helix-turn-helix domain-containing protein [bacterium]HNS47964.1 winged helix-turn-helix domain-containing protein [bacterium]